MGIVDRIFGRRGNVEARSSIENPQVPISSDDFFAYFGGGSFGKAAGVNVSTSSALGVPAIWDAVNFLSGTLAGLPLHVYKRTRDGRKRVEAGGLAEILGHAVNDHTPSFSWRKMMFERVFTDGRAFTFIERVDGQIANLWLLNNGGVRVKAARDAAGRRTIVYQYTADGVTVDYRADEIIDLVFMYKPNGLDHFSPIQTCKEAIGQAIAASRYGSRFFEGGGVPPFAITGNFKAPGAMQRASEDLARAVEKASGEGRSALALPSGLDIKSIGVDPAKGQLLESRRWHVEEVARIYSLPPTFLQDLSHGTFSNTEQQDLHFVKHTVKRWVEQAEQEINLKIYGRGKRKEYVEFNMDGLLRGDFLARMDGYAKGIQNGILKPNEARRRENMPDDPAGDQLLIQGATVPLAGQPGAADPLPLDTSGGDENA